MVWRDPAGSEVLVLLRWGHSDGGGCGQRDMDVALASCDGEWLCMHSGSHADTPASLPCPCPQNDAVIRSLFDAKTEEIGPGIYRFKAEIAFNGEMIAGGWCCPGHAACAKVHGAAGPACCMSTSSARIG